MANQINIDIGAAANDGTGDPLRTAFNYVNLNFANVWATGLPNSNVQFNNNRILTVNTNANLVLSPNGTGVVQSNVSILPNIDRVHSLGSAARRWYNVYSNYLDVNTVDVNGNLTVAGNLTVEGDTIQIGNIVTDTKTIQLSNTAVTANTANGSGITVGANDNIATMLYSSTSNTWTMNIGANIAGNVTAPYFIGNGALLTGIVTSSYANANAVAYGQAGWAGNIIPAGNAVYSLGNATNQWNDLYVSNATIFMNNVPISLGAGNVLTVNGNAVLQNDSNTSITTTGNISAANLAVTGSGLTWANASIIQTSSEDFSITGDGQVTVRSLDGTYQWTFGSNGILSVPLAPSGASNQIKYGMGNLVGYLGSGWTIGEYNGTDYGTEGIRINPGIEGPADIVLPADPANVPVQINNYSGNVRIQTGEGDQWTFNTAGSLNIPGSIVSTSTITIDNRASGNSADINLYSADDILIQARDRSAGSGSEGGDINIYAGDSAEDGDTSGGDITIEAGRGGAANVDFGGSGGFITIQSGQGGAASTEISGSNANDGGALTLRAGSAGSNMGNIARGAAGGEVIVRGGDSTGNLDVGGSITLQPGSGGDNASAGAVYINIPFSTQGPGGEWLFGGTGNTLTTPADAVISSADGNLRIRSSFNTVLNADPYNWTFNNDGGLVTAPISIPTEGPTGEAQSLRGTRRLIGGYESTYPYSQILDNNSGSTVAWVATDSNTRSARITFQITYTDVSFGFAAREILTVDVVQDLLTDQAYFSVSGRVGTNGYAPGVVSASVTGGVININIVPDGIYYYGLVVYDAVEFKGPLD